MVALNLFEAESKKTSQLEKEIDNLKIKNVSEETQPVKITEVTESENDIVKDFTNFKIINETILKPADQKYLSLLNENLKRFHSQFQILNESMIEAFSQYNVEKNQWIKKETEYRDEIEILKMNLQNNINDTQEISETKEKSFLERKLKYMEECVKQSRSQRENILSDFLSYKIDKLKTINNLELLQQKLNFQIIEMHNTLRNTIPIEMFLKQNTLLNETQLKYRDILNKQLKNIESNKNQFVNIDASKEVLMTEITLIKKEKNTLEQLLKDEASKNVILSSGGKSQSII